MKTENFTLNGNSSNGNSRPGFLQIAIGGAGKDSVKSTIKQHEAAGEPFPRSSPKAADPRHPKQPL